MKKNSSQPNSKPLSSSAATFTARELKPYSTLLEFTYTKPSISNFHNQTNLFALALLRLWIKRKKSIDGNLIPQYEYCTHTKKLTELRMPTDVATYYEKSAIKMNYFFNDDTAQNLGSLSLLNALMSSKFESESLGITSSHKTYTMYFTQKLCSFWLDYFENSNTSNLLETPFLENESCDFTTNQTHKRWWDVALDRHGRSPIQLSRLFLNERVETTLRIMLTPRELLLEIAKPILGETKMANAFFTYFMNKINQFQSQFNSKVPKWMDYIHDHGSQDFNIYLTEVMQFCVEKHCVTENIPIKELLIINAMSCSIHSLEQIELLGDIKNYSIQHKVVSFHYFIQRIRNDWNEISNQPKHHIWSIIEQISEGLYSEIHVNCIQTPVIEEITQEIPDFLIKAIAFRKNHLATFLLLQKPSLLSSLTNNAIDDLQIWRRQHSLMTQEISDSIADALMSASKSKNSNSTKIENDSLSAKHYTHPSNAGFFNDKFRHPNSKRLIQKLNPPDYSSKQLFT